MGGVQRGTASGKEQSGRQELMLLEREKDASALINVLLGNQNEFVAWRSQTDAKTGQTQTDRERGGSCSILTAIHLSHLRRAKAGVREAQGDGCSGNAQSQAA